MDVETQKQSQGQETQKVEQRQQTEAVKNINEWSNQANERSLLEQAKEYAERIERANAESRQILAEHEKIMSMQLLGGRTNAGFTAPIQEDTPEQYADKLRKGLVNPFKV